MYLLAFPVRGGDTGRFGSPPPSSSSLSGGGGGNGGSGHFPSGYRTITVNKSLRHSVADPELAPRIVNQETMTIQRHPKTHHRHHVHSDVPAHSPPPYHRSAAGALGLFRGGGGGGGGGTPTQTPTKTQQPPTQSAREYRRVVGNSEFFYPGVGVPCSGDGDGGGGGGGGGGSRADIMYADPKDAVAAKKNFFTNNTLTVSKVRKGWATTVWDTGVINRCAVASL